MWRGGVMAESGVSGKGNTRVVWALAGASLAAITAGGALAVRALGPPPPERAAATTGPGCCSDPAVHGRKPPAEFGLPAAPGAFDFHSMETHSGVGSVAYSVRGGTAGQVARFYR